MEEEKGRRQLDFQLFSLEWKESGKKMVVDGVFPPSQPIFSS